MTETEIRERLERLGERVDAAPDAFERLARRRVRAERRRRASTAVLAFVIAIGGTVGLVYAFRGEGADRIGGSATPIPTVGVGTHTYRDPLGWQIEVPDGWHVLRTGGRSSVLATTVGTPKLRVLPGDLGGTRPDLSVFGRNDVGLIVWRYEGSPALTTHPDPSFPLRWEDFKTIPGDDPLSLTQDFWVNGRKFGLQAGGFATAPPERFELLQRAIESLRPINPPAVSLDSLPGTSWKLIEIDGTPVPEVTLPNRPGSAAFVEFTVLRLGGFDGCNSYGARYWLEGNRLDVRGFFQTLVLCSGDIGDRSNAFGARMAAGGTLSMDGDILTLVSQQGTLTFTRA